MDWQGLPYSLMRPSVDQVSEYLSTLLGCWGRAPTRSLTERSLSKCLISSLAAMLMKPGRQPALRHEGLRCTSRDAPHGRGDGDVFGQIEVMRVALARGLGDGRIAVERQARDDGVRLVDREVFSSAFASLASSATARKDREP